MALQHDLRARRCPSSGGNLAAPNVLVHAGDEWALEHFATRDEGAAIRPHADERTVEVPGGAAGVIRLVGPHLGRGEGGRTCQQADGQQARSDGDPAAHTRVGGGVRARQEGSEVAPHLAVDFTTAP